MTDNHNYNEPSKGATDWHIPINANWQAIDTDVEIRDTDANRSSYTPKAGAKYLATDTLKVYFGDGSNWNEQADLSNIGTGGSLTTAEQNRANSQLVGLETGTSETSGSTSGENNRFVEQPLTLLDGHQFKLYRAGSQDTVSGDSTLRVYRGDPTAADNSGWTEIYSTTSSVAFNGDGSGAVDYTNPLVTESNTSGSDGWIIIRATYEGSTTPYSLWGEAVVLRESV
jgi:hypothetical protein